MSSVIAISGVSTVTPINFQSFTAIPSYTTTVFKGQSFDYTSYQIVNGLTTTFSGTDNSGNAISFYIVNNILYAWSGSYPLSQGQTVFITASSGFDQVQMSNGAYYIGTGTPSFQQYSQSISALPPLILPGNTSAFRAYSAPGYLTNYSPQSGSGTGSLTYVAQNDVVVTPNLPAPWQPVQGSVNYGSGGVNATVSWQYNTSSGVTPTGVTISYANNVYQVNPSVTSYTVPGPFVPGQGYTFQITTSANGKSASGSAFGIVAPPPATITSLNVAYDQALLRTNVSWTVSSQQAYQGATVAWNNNAGDSGSQQASGANFNWILFLKGGVYTVTVTVGTSSLSQTVTVPGQLPPPANVVFTLDNSKVGQATISWSYPSQYYANNATFSAGPTDNSFILMQQPATLSPTQRSYTLTGLKANVRYSYTLTLNNTLVTVNYPGQSFVSFSPPPALTNLTASYVRGTYGQINLSWKVSPSDAVPPWFTEVKYSDNNSALISLVQGTSVTPPPTTATINVGKGAHAIYVVASGPSSNGPSSNIVQVNVPGELPGSVSFSDLQQQGGTLTGSASWSYSPTIDVANIVNASVEVAGVVTTINPQSTTATFTVPSYGGYLVTLNIDNGVDKKSFTSNYAITFVNKPSPAPAPSPAPPPGPTPTPPGPSPTPSPTGPTPTPPGPSPTGPAPTPSPAPTSKSRNLWIWIGIGGGGALLLLVLLLLLI